MVIKLVIEVVGRIFVRRPTAVCSRPSATVTAATRTANPTGKFSPIPPCGVATVRSSTAFYPAHFSGLRCPAPTAATHLKYFRQSPPAPDWVHRRLPTALTRQPTAAPEARRSAVPVNNHSAAVPLFRVKINLKKAFKVLTPATAGDGVPLWVLAAGVGFATFLAAVVYFATAAAVCGGACWSRRSKKWRKKKKWTTTKTEHR